ncbi:MAG: dipeptide/oligopeptide/nickel ABC transporter permease/ATP-binding protein [Sphingobium sp.]
MKLSRPLILPVALLAILIAALLLVPVLPLDNPTKLNIMGRLAGSSWAHPLGQDDYGRDVLSRMMWGARLSLGVSFAAAAVAAVIGTMIGITGGYFRGFAELFTTRLSEIILCFPPMLLALLIVTLLGPGPVTLTVSLAILFTPAFARIAYSQTLAVAVLPYVTAQQTLGTRAPTILVRTVLPNIAAPLLVQFSLTVASAMLLESGLSFLGLGVVPPDASWGLMIRSARSFMGQAPMLIIWPCLALVLTVLLINFLVSRMRQVLDPKAEIKLPDIGVLRREKDTSPIVFADANSVVELQNVTIGLAGADGLTHPVRNVTMSVRSGETVALVGESGSGKTLTSLSIMGLLPETMAVTGGRIALRNKDGEVFDTAAMDDEELRALRGRDIGFVLQDPSVSLNPVRRVGDQFVEAILAHQPISYAHAKARAVELLGLVGLPDPAGKFESYPHEMSGGQRQRVSIAIAIANRPRLLIADEPTTALDVVVQKQIVRLLQDLMHGGDGMAMIFVTHNLGLVAEMADRVVVMYRGDIVEQGPTREVFTHPAHDYTRSLLASMPDMEARRKVRPDEEVTA